MIQRPRYPKEVRERLVLEILSGQSSIAQISKRENISGNTLAKWRDELSSGTFVDDRKKELELRKRVADLEATVAELALENTILKKTEKIMRELKRRERSSGPISLKNSELKGAPGRSD